ncbi:MAG: SIMPL domain-containing protein [Patescibacteria group bacterium]
MAKEYLKFVVFSLGLAIFLLLGILGMNTLGISWGKVEFLPASTITVTGEAKKQESNQIANFYAGVSASNDDKQEAIDEVNTKMTDIVKKIKEFGIEDKDIQTQNVNVNENQQAEILIYPPTDSKQQAKWSANNSITITLRDVAKAQALTDMLTATGATNVSGPNYSLDSYSDASEDLLADAIVDAKTKAEKIAKASGRRLGKVITVSEGGSPVYYPVALESKGRGGDTTSVPTPVEPGSQTVYKSVTVVFELR